MFACNYNNPCQPQGAQGAQGAQGSAKVSATFDFKLRLTGENTLFNPTPVVAIPGVFSLDQAEFLYPTNMGIFVPRNPTYPVVSAGSPTLPTWTASQSNNHHLFYVMPKTGVVTGYTVNFCAIPYGNNTTSGLFRSQFGIGIATPSSFSPNIGININQSPTDPNSSYSSAYYNLPTPQTISQGSYLGCFCYHPNSGFAANHAQGDTHMTVHVVFDE